MSRFVVCLMAVSLLCGCARNAQIPTPSQPSAAVELYVPSEISQKAAERVAASLQKNLGAAVVRVNGMKAADKDSLLVVLRGYQPPHKDIDEAKLIQLEGNTGDNEVVLRRIEKRVLATLSFSLGFKSCRNPLCVLHPYENLSDLDSIARDICPVCIGSRQAGGDHDVPKVLLVVL